MTSGTPFSLVLHDGAYDRLHYALVMASAAAAIGRRVTLLLAGDAVHLLAKTWQPPAEDATARAKGVAGIEELLDACNELGTRIIVCETALVLADLTTDDLRTDITWESGGFVSYLNAAGDDGQMLFI